MAALGLLLGVAALLLGLGAVARWAPWPTGRLAAGLGVLGAVAALAAPEAATLAGPVRFGIDGVSAIPLAAMLLWGAAAQASPVALGAAVLALLAQDAVVLWAGVAVAALAPAGGDRRVAVAGLCCLAVAVLALGGVDPRFAAIRAAPTEGVRAAAALMAAVGAAGLLARGPAGAVLGVYVLGRLLLDLAGPVTPGWWGGAGAALGAALALDAARRAGAEESLTAAADRVGEAALGVAVMGLGGALAARGTDMLPLAAMAAAAALLQVLAWGVWGALLALSARACGAAAGGDALPRMGGLLRRAPVAGWALLLGLACAAALPATAGFPGGWGVAQSMLGAGRGGGAVLPLLAAAALGALGLAAAMLMAAAVRLGGAAVLGVPRSAKAAAAVQPARPMRLALGGLAAATLVLGACPGLGLMLVQPGVRRLTGRTAEGAGWLMLAPAPDAPGYAAPAIAMLVAAGAAAAVWCSRGPAGRAAAWQGGFIEDGVGRGNLPAAPLPAPKRVGWDRAVLVALGAAVAAALGWAAR